MQISGIDHVNILTDDLEGTARFYETALGLSRAENPTIAKGIAGYWMRDGSGQAIVHLVDRLSAAGRYDDYRPGQPTNALHHVAMRCEGFAQACAGLDALGIAYRTSDHPDLRLKQIFLADPNAVNLELNFRES